jgi:hypothetical protein
MEKENETYSPSEEFTSRRGRNHVAEISENMKVWNVTLHEGEECDTS